MPESRPVLTQKELDEARRSREAKREAEGTSTQPRVIGNIIAHGDGQPQGNIDAIKVYIGGSWRELELQEITELCKHAYARWTTRDGGAAPDDHPLHEEDGGRVDVMAAPMTRFTTMCVRIRRLHEALDAGKDFTILFTEDLEDLLRQERESAVEEYRRQRPLPR